MIIYITRDYEPQGGFYSGSLERTPPPFADEIRRADDFPDEVWEAINQGGLTPGPDGTFDDLWFPYFDRAVTIWRR